MAVQLQERKAIGRTQRLRETSMSLPIVQFESAPPNGGISTSANPVVAKSSESTFAGILQARTSSARDAEAANSAPVPTPARVSVLASRSRSGVRQEVPRAPENGRQGNAGAVFPVPPPVVVPQTTDSKNAPATAGIEADTVNDFNPLSSQVFVVPTTARLGVPAANPQEAQQFGSTALSASVGESFTGLVPELPTAPSAATAEALPPSSSALSAVNAATSLHNLGLSSSTPPAVLAKGDVASAPPAVSTTLASTKSKSVLPVSPLTDGQPSSLPQSKTLQTSPERNLVPEGQSAAPHVQAAEPARALAALVHAPSVPQSTIAHANDSTVVEQATSQAKNPVAAQLQRTPSESHGAFPATQYSEHVTITSNSGKVSGASSIHSGSSDSSASNQNTANPPGANPPAPGSFGSNSQAPISPGPGGLAAAASGAAAPSAGTISTNATGPAVAQIAPTPTGEASAPALPVPSAPNASPGLVPADAQAQTPPNPVQSARIVNNATQAEMHIGLRTQTFGNVEVRTQVRESQVGVTVSSERGDLRSMLTPEVGSLQATLRHQDLRFDNINFQTHSFGGGDATASNGHSRSQPQAVAGRSAEEARSPAPETLPASVISAGNLDAGNGLSVIA